MSWIKLTRESMATEEDWNVVTEVAIPNERDEVLLFTEDRTKEELGQIYEAIFERYEICMRSCGRWGAIRYCVIWDTKTKDYLRVSPDLGGKAYLEFRKVKEAIEYLLELGGATE